MGLWHAIDGFFHSITYWHWFGAGAVLLVIEILSGSGFFFWVGLSAVITGILSWLIPEMIWPYQFLFFAFFSIVVAVAWWKYLKVNPPKTEDDTLNQRNLKYINRVFVLEDNIENGIGFIRVDDSRWRVRCTEDFPAGTKIRISGVDGVTLIAEKHSE